MSYYRWTKLLGNDIELAAVEYAGRGRKSKIKPYNSFSEAVDDIYNYVRSQVEDCAFALFGHSMGSWIAYEVGVRLEKESKKYPVHIFFSGRYPPHISNVEDRISNLPDRDFTDRIKEFGGMDRQVLDNKELMDLFLPIIRADLKILEEKEPVKNIWRFNCDITVFSGKEDKIMEYYMEEWKYYTCKKINFIEIDGDHFFLFQNSEDTVSAIREILLEK
jgi:medium-chain acyl-[acyl-carrier-protein] hydrolase